MPIKPSSPRLILCLAGLLSFVLIWPLAVFADATAGAAANAEPAHTQSYTPPAIELEFPEGRDVVEVPFELSLNKIIVPVTINGSEPYDFVLDTGASHALLHSKHPPADLSIVGQSILQGAGDGESTTVDLANEVTFGLGDVKLHKNLMAVTPPDSPIIEHMGREWQGVFGRQVFDNLVVEIRSIGPTNA